MNTLKNVKIKNYSQVGMPSKSFTYEHVTPTGERFNIIGKGIDKQGCPTFHITFDNEKVFKQIASVPSSKRKGLTVYKDRGFAMFKSYNTGMTIKRLFDDCKIAEMIGLK